MRSFQSGKTFLLLVMQLFKLIFQTAICLKMLLNPLASIVFSCFFPSFVIVVSICLRSAVELSPPSPTIELFCCQACVSGAVTVFVCVCVCASSCDAAIWRCICAATFFVPSAFLFPSHTYSKQIIKKAAAVSLNNKTTRCQAKRKTTHCAMENIEAEVGVGALRRRRTMPGRQGGASASQLFGDWQRRRPMLWRNYQAKIYNRATKNRINK